MRRFIMIAFAAGLFIFFTLPKGSADEVKKSLLKNGIVTLIEESHKAPLTAIQARIKTGSATEDGYLGTGISHFVEHMLFKGTSKWPMPGTIEREIKSQGGYINAFTSYDSTDVVIIVPSARTYEALEILKGILTESLFDPKELEKEREVILKEIRLDNDDPARRLSQLLWSNVFRSHNYRLPVIGYEDLFKKLTREDLVKYYQTKYIPDNILLAVVGDIDTEEAYKQADKLFGEIERVSPSGVPSKVEPRQIAAVEIKEESAVNLCYLAMGYHSVSIRDKDLFALDVLSMLLGSGEDSRLSRSLRRERQLVYSLDCSNYTPKDPGIFLINAVLKNEMSNQAIDEIRKQINILKVKFAPDNELNKAKNMVLSSYIFSRQTVEERASDLIEGEALTGDYDFSKKYVEGIKAVTREDVRRVAGKYLRDEALTTVMLVPPQSAKPAAAGQKASKKAKDAANIERFEFKNGLRVFILEDHNLPIVSLSAFGLGGLRTENFNDNGIANLVSETLLTGTKKNAEEQIFSKVEGAGGDISSVSGGNTFSISADGLSGDFNMLSETFADCVENPLFAADKIQREKAVILAGISSIDDDIYESGIRTLKYTLFNNSPYRLPLLGRPSSISQISRNEILNYYNTYYCPANMVLAVSGDIDGKAAAQKISALFEKAVKKPAPVIRPQKDTKRARPRALKRKIEKEQSLILLGYPGTTIYNHDKYIMEVLCSALSGINGRLSKTIREERGLAYALDAVSIPGIEPGMIVFYIGTTNRNLALARDELFKEIELFTREGISDEELRSAKSELIGHRGMRLQKTADIAAEVSLNELFGLGYDNYLKYEERINHITKECALRAAKKYLNNYSYVLLTMEGQEKI
ncbi:MAG: pitrilysin family protein [Candidatus Omnitrophica bacterium]|nr:pitrilysin family protein [Candidatus Omnitrophota bacterium]